MAALIALVALVGFAMFGGAPYKVTAVFENGGQLVKGNQVEIGGRPVGTVSGMKLTSDGQAVVDLSLKEGSPLHRGTTATIRTPSLSGIANRYVSLKPGPNSGPELADGSRIGVDQTSAPVDLDQLFNTLTPRTRLSLQRVIQGSSAQYAGRAKQSRESLK